VIGAAAGADGDDLTLLRLLLGGVGNDDAASGLVGGFDAANEHAIVQWAEFHDGLTSCWGNDDSVDAASRAASAAKVAFWHSAMESANPTFPRPIAGRRQAIAAARFASRSWEYGPFATPGAAAHLRQRVGK